MKKIGITFGSLSDEKLDEIKKIAPDYEVSRFDRNDARLKECEIVFGMINPAFVSQSQHLKWLHTSYAGVDSFLKPEVNFPEEVILTNSAGTYGIAISEWMLTAMLMLMRRNIEYAKLQFKNTWQPLGEVKSVYGSNICVIGLGDIGENFAKRCKALGATVSGVVRNPRANKPDSVDRLHTIDQLDEAIRDADVVAICLPGTAETVGLFDAQRLNKMKQDALLLNVGRGTIIDQDALIEALNTGHLGGAGLDVTDPEPLPSDSSLWQMKNVIITPHISGNETLKLTTELISNRFIQYLKDYVAGKPFEKVVDKRLGY